MGSVSGPTLPPPENFRIQLGLASGSPLLSQVQGSPLLLLLVGLAACYVVGALYLLPHPVLAFLQG